MARFLVVFLAGVALLAYLASSAVQRTTRRWFEADIAQRMAGLTQKAQPALLARWTAGSREPFEAMLADLARDERITAAGACDQNNQLLARSPAFPRDLGCAEVRQRMAAEREGQPATPGLIWGTNWSLPGGNVYLSAVPVARDSASLGLLLLVQDLSSIDRKDARLRQLLLMVFAGLALCAAAVTVVAARLSWRGFRKELRRFILGESRRKEFLPIVADVRELVERIAAEREMDGPATAWNAQHLKQALVRHFPGEKVIVLANREPYIHERGSDGTIQIRHPASGLVAAVEPALRACSGVWIAHGSGSADRTVVDSQDHVRVPPGEESYVLRRVWLSEQEERGYYYGLANEGLWPLCHLAHARPIFRSTDWATYEAVNRRFAEAVCDEAEGEDPVVLVQDYHFALVPRLVRERRPRATIITFWHIPWPNGEHFGICPWRAQILQGMLGSSIMGFHTRQHCNNFLDSVDRYLEARIDREQNAVVQHGRATLVRPYPISIEWPSQWVASAPPVAECRSGIRKELGLRDDALLGLGVDRLDYTKGIEERLLTVERFLERFPTYAGRFSFVQLAAPSRTLIERYRQLDETVERTAARINQRFGEGAYQPIILLRAHHEPPQVFRYYRGADLCYVSSLHDGMNLVAKEFAAARDDERGVLLLSQFTGAARELSEALVVNPYDLEEASAAMARALAMPPEEQRERMRAMRAFLAEFNVYRWAGRMLMDAARLRRKGTLLSRNGEGVSNLPGLLK
jgi:trehalose 6-phosphate synthase